MKESISIKQLGLLYSVAMLTTACFKREDRGSPLLPSTPPSSREGSPDSETSIATQGPEQGSPAPSDATGVKMGKKNLSIEGSTPAENATKGGSVAATTTTTTAAAGNDSRGSSTSNTSSSTPVTNPTTQMEAASNTPASNTPTSNTPASNTPASNTPASNNLRINDSPTESSTSEVSSTDKPGPPLQTESRLTQPTMQRSQSGSSLAYRDTKENDARKDGAKGGVRTKIRAMLRRNSSCSAPSSPKGYRKQGEKNKDKKVKQDEGKPEKA